MLIFKTEIQFILKPLALFTCCLSKVEQFNRVEISRFIRCFKNMTRAALPENLAR